MIIKLHLPGPVFEWLYGESDYRITVFKPDVLDAVAEKATELSADLKWSVTSNDVLLTIGSIYNLPDLFDGETDCGEIMRGNLKANQKKTVPLSLAERTEEEVAWTTSGHWGYSRGELVFCPRKIPLLQYYAANLTKDLNASFSWVQVATYCLYAMDHCHDIRLYTLNEYTEIYDALKTSASELEGTQWYKGVNPGAGIDGVADPLGRNLIPAVAIPRATED